jgi:Icc-related predicted phosphoesterase
MKEELTCVGIADTHGMYADLEIPYADVFIHAGDITRNGTLPEIKDFNDWLGRLPHKYKVIIGGNHDKAFEKKNRKARALITNAIYLQDEFTIIEGVKFYGSPWQPAFYNWSFNLRRGDELKAKWDLIPNDTDVLITHGPALNFLDRVDDGTNVGCRDLLEAIWRVKPKVHVCGHIHEGYGEVPVDEFGVHFINCSTCTSRYKPINPPILFSVLIGR